MNEVSYMKTYYKLLAVVGLTLVSLAFYEYFKMGQQDVSFVQPKLLANYPCSIEDTILGIDVSYHNGRIDWKALKANHPEVEFVYIRCAVGHNRVDTLYKYNVRSAREVGIKTGPYVYYFANSNSTAQFKNFKDHVLMDEHDLVPVLDIERQSVYGVDNLRRGLSNWLQLVENEYGVKPAIYTNLGYFEEYLYGYFNEYPKWIAAYSRCPSNVDWDIHQFSENGRFIGAEGYIDMNYCEQSSFDKFLIL